MCDNERFMARARKAFASKTPVLVEGGYREAAVLVAITVGAVEPAIILTERAGHLSIHPGESAFPGGKRDSEDKTLLSTALREANEEVGLAISEFDYLGALDQHLTRSNIKVSPFVGLVSSDAFLKANLDEVSCIYKIPVSFLLEKKNLMIVEKVYQGMAKKVPHFEYQGFSIWGVTALILVDLLNTAFGAELELG